MGVTFSLILVAVGAVLRFAVSAEIDGWDLRTTGVVLMAVGLVGLVISLIFWSTWGGFGNRRSTLRDPREGLGIEEPHL